VLVDYPEEKFGGFLARTDYRDPFIQDEIEANGWMIWPPIRYSYTTVNNIPHSAPTAPFLLDEGRPARPIHSRTRTPAARSAT
jgi:microcin C transport system permease protein